MFRTTVVVIASLISLHLAAAVTPTRVVVRVVAHDGKILGTDSGGAEITILDADTHKVLASGTQNGNSGDTTQIMVTPHVRGDAVFANATATSFNADLPLTKPTRVEIVAVGPIAFPESKQRTTTTLWVLPGQSMDPATEDGIVMELYGFGMKFDRVSPESPGALAVTAHVAMMCGCPIAKDGPWPEARFTVLASLRRKGTAIAEKRMVWTATSTFATTFDNMPGGTYELVVTSSDKSQANFSQISRSVSF